MPELDSLSVLLLWTAIAIYAAAFVAFAFDLASRSAAQTARADALVGAGVAAGATAASGGAEAGGDAPASGDQPRPRLVMARIGTSLTVLGFLFHLGATVTRGIAAGRVPWANLYEFAMIGTLLVVAVFLAVLTRLDLRYLGTFIVGLIVVLLGLSSTNFYVPIVPLMDPLKSVWLIIHVFVASLSTALLALAFALSVMQLMQTRRERLIAEGAAKTGPGFLRTIPDAARLENLAYRFTVVGFIFWTFTLIAGAIWAQDAWGRYWGFDVKETWTFIIWVLYAGYIHARATRGWRGTPSAWLSITGFAAVLFNFTIVNVFFKGLHAYSGLS
ncbi:MULTISPECIES: c-type cytochrome biogenesis protein CcsB [Microbacterium]|uniref:c-type cytochrome biogenesis protein CcsB n=1 Tax=Microbacterium TaxID=33882 RepID=UPI00217CCA2A|nr:MULTISPECIES: c-type cytochrome biogenesis protein CcsB [Microbacterium]UWF77836.1 c-type cytochrome biogenesis protein CcsB [Microbacterium neungamense]WCM56012.1 c-type cytochrome biogenesis protein CcsB [Microbacterium sp. EF45047]